MSLGMVVRMSTVQQSGIKAADPTLPRPRTHMSQPITKALALQITSITYSMRSLSQTHQARLHLHRAPFPMSGLTQRLSVLDGRRVPQDADSALHLIEVLIG
jgi:hypothetical protein